MNQPIIRGLFKHGKPQGFVIWVFNQFLQEYEVIDRQFKQHKHAVLARDSVLRLAL